jgi:hypothetical protein
MKNGCMIVLSINNGGLKVKIILVVAVIILMGCGAGWTDFDDNLGANFKHTYIAKQTSYIYRYNKNPNSIDSIYVWPTVDRVMHNDNYIIVKQIPDREIIDDYSKTSKINKKLLTKTLSFEICYWIIEKNSKKRYGPYSLEEFEIKREELGVPDSLDFRSWLGIFSFE